MGTSPYLAAGESHRTRPQLARLEDTMSSCLTWIWPSAATSAIEAITVVLVQPLSGHLGSGVTIISAEKLPQIRSTRGCAPVSSSKTIVGSRLKS